MKYIAFRRIAVCIVVGFMLTGFGYARDLSYPQIVSRLYDLKQLANEPDIAESSGCFSSRDRAAIFSSVENRYKNWYSNDDGSGYIRQESEGIVAAEIEGPGVIWRIWSAMPERGLIKFYIDGAAEPALAIPFIDYFNNSKEPFNYPALVRDNARGKNSYIPIAFQKSCKVVLCNGWGRYYQITWSKFSPDTVVKSFDGTFNAEGKEALKQADDIWSGRNNYSAVNTSGDLAIKKEIHLEPAQTAVLADIDKPAAISLLKIKLPDLSEDRARDLLRQISLSIYWDGQGNPSVWSPLGDFFGSAPGLNPYSSLPFEMTYDELICRWYMPFSSAKIELLNESGESLELGCQIELEPLTAEKAESIMRFHAKWHRDNYLPVGRDRLMNDRWPDWMVLYTDNTKGRFCGMALHLWNPLHMWDRERASKYQWPFPDSKYFRESGEYRDFFAQHVLPETYWWGEGDEKFFVDGETMPSTFGTGTEDYFGFAWGTPSIFDSAVQCQTLNHNNVGHISLCRWQVADNVPFQQSFVACIEKYHDNNWPLRYAVTAYWYQQHGTVDGYEPVPVCDRTGYYDYPQLKQ